MVAVPRRPLVALLFAALVSTSIILLLHTPPRWQSFADRFGVETFLPPDHRYQLDLGFISSSYVVSLPHRQDRQSDIVKLMHLMDFHNWEFFDGVYANTSLVKNLMRHVVAERANVDWADGGDWMRMSFEWPIDAAETYSPPDSDYSSTLASGGAELWPAHELPEIEIPPMMCSEDDFNLQKYRTDVPQWRFLTPERVATYHSHLTLLRRIVEVAARRGVDVRRNPDWQQQDITLVMEDDVDMEIDIAPRMAELLPLLPYDWDLLYLGFCWSSETQHPPLVGQYRRPTKNQVHPSDTPRCTHAMAYSPAGAMRILAHLRHPPFAYSRSVDTALEWLIRSGRIKSYTVVPPPMIQRKMAKSDVTLVDFVRWEETLENGALGTTGNEV